MSRRALQRNQQPLLQRRRLLLMLLTHGWKMNLTMAATGALCLALTACQSGLAGKAPDPPSSARLEYLVFHA